MAGNVAYAACGVMSFIMVLILTKPYAKDTRGLVVAITAALVVGIMGWTGLVIAVIAWALER